MRWLDKIPEKNKNLGCRIIDGEAVVIAFQNLLDVNLDASQEFVIFNETATRVWQLCDGDRTTKEILEQLKEEYDIEENKEAEAQIGNLIDELTQCRLISIKEVEL